MSCVNEILLKALQQEEAGAFEQLYSQYYQPSYKKALSMVADEYLAEDLVQDVFIYLWENKKYQQIRTSLSAYLQKMVFNKCNSHFREEKRQRQQREDYLLTLTPDAPVNDKLDKVRYAYATLSAHQQRALQKVYCDELSYQEAAAIMGINYETLRTHLKRGMLKMKTQLQ
jgi:RNA polymerase sigma factor (sigma-70 family)